MCCFYFFFFFFNDAATTEIYTLSLHDALPISPPAVWRTRPCLLSERPSSMTCGPIWRAASATASRRRTSRASRPPETARNDGSAREAMEGGRGAKDPRGVEARRAEDTMRTGRALPLRRPDPGRGGAASRRRGPAGPGGAGHSERAGRDDRAARPDRVRDNDPRGGFRRSAHLGRRADARGGRRLGAEPGRRLRHRLGARLDRRAG